MKKLLFLGAIAILGLSNCTKECKECKLVEKQGDLVNEYSMGEKCGKELEEIETADARCTSECYYVCE